MNRPGLTVLLFTWFPCLASAQDDVYRISCYSEMGEGKVNGSLAVRSLARHIWTRSDSITFSFSPCSFPIYDVAAFFIKLHNRVLCHISLKSSQKPNNKKEVEACTAGKRAS